MNVHTPHVHTVGGCAYTSCTYCGWVYICTPHVHTVGGCTYVHLMYILWMGVHTPHVHTVGGCTYILHTVDQCTPHIHDLAWSTAEKVDNTDEGAIIGDDFISMVLTER